MSDPELGADDVDLVIGGETVTLRYTLAAERAIARTFDGPIAAAKSAQNGNSETIATIIAIGTGRKPAEFEAAVFKSNKIELLEPIGRYLLAFITGPQAVRGGPGDENP